MNNINDIADSDAPEKSLNVAIEEVAQLLRTEVKSTTTLEMKQKQGKLLSLQALGPSMSNSIKQVARLLRTQVQKKNLSRSEAMPHNRPEKPNPLQQKRKQSQKNVKNS